MKHLQEVLSFIKNSVASSIGLSTVDENEQNTEGEECFRKRQLVENVGLTAVMVETMKLGRIYPCYVLRCTH